MDKIELQIKTVCVVSLFAGVISALIPQGRMKSAFSSFCAVVVIFHLVTPLTSIKTDSSEFFGKVIKEKENTFVDEVKTAEVMIYENALESALEKNLAEKGTEVKIEAVCEKTGDEITVVSFTVYSAAGEKEKEEVLQILNSGFCNAAVSFKEEENG